MLTALHLIFDPTNAWTRIVERQRPVWQIVLFSLVPTILIACAVEGWGLHTLGTSPSWGGISDRAPHPVNPTTIIRYETAQTILLLACVITLSLLLRVVLKTMNCRATRGQVFTAVAYSFAPVLLLVAADGIPYINPWVCRAIGVALACRAFYVGLVRVIRPDPTSALGVFVTSSFLMLALVGLVEFVVLQILENRLLSTLFS